MLQLPLIRSQKPRGAPKMARGSQDVRVANTSSQPRRSSSIGAGDTFIAGLLFGMTCHPHDWELQRKLSFGVDLATCKVQLDGFQGLATKMGQMGVTQTSCLDRT